MDAVVGALIFLGGIIVGALLILLGASAMQGRETDQDG